MTEQLAGIISTVGPIVLLLVVFYFFLIRPQNKRQKEIDKMLSELKTGDRVKTIGGIYGRITHVKDDIITIECGPSKVELVFDRRAISTVEDVANIENTMNS